MLQDCDNKDSISFGRLDRRERTLFGIFIIRNIANFFLRFHEFFNLSFLIKRVERYESVYCIYAHWNSWSVCNEFRRFFELFLNLRKSNDCLIFLIKYNNANFAILFSRTWKCCLFLTCNKSQKKFFVFLQFMLLCKNLCNELM